jgi:hypothetical protein
MMINHNGGYIILMMVIVMMATGVMADDSSSLLSAPAPTAGSYSAAVVEHTVYQGHAGDSADVLKNKNLDMYQQHVELAAQAKVQIIVFPGMMME